MNNSNRESQDDSLLNGVPYQSERKATRKRGRWQWMAPTTLALAMAVMLPSRTHAGSSNHSRRERRCRRRSCDS